MNQNVPRGQLSTILLSTLLTGDKYGYEIIKDIKDKTEGDLIVKQPSLYSSLSRMEKQGFITSYWRDSELGGKRHYYSLTDLGRKQLEQLEDNFYISHKNISNCLTVPVSSSATNGQASNIDENKTVFRSENTNLNFIKPSLNKVKNNSKDFNINDENFEKHGDNNMATTTEDSISLNDVFLSKSNNAILHQNTFLGSSDPIQIGAEKSLDNNNNELANQINIFDTSKNLNKKQFNIEEELANLKAEHKSFTDEIKMFSKEKNDSVFWMKDNSNFSKELGVEKESGIYQSAKIQDFSGQNPQQSQPLDDYYEKNETTYSTKICNTETKAKDDAVFINQPTPKMLKKGLYESDVEEKECEDIGIFITDKYLPEDMPRVKKINALHLDNSVNDSSIKFNPNKVESGYTEKINELYNQSNQVNEKNFSDSMTIDSYDKLQEYYDKIDVKFSTYPALVSDKQINNHVNSINYNKASSKKYLTLFLIAFLETLVCYFAFKNFDLPLNYSYVFIIIPALFLILPAYHAYHILAKKEQYVSEIKLNAFWLDLMIFLVGAVLLYSLNMLLGMTYLNVDKFATTFIFPAILLSNILVNYFLNLYFFKNIKIKYTN